MFDDPKKELELLQEQLMKDEEWFERELDSAKRMIGVQPEKKPQRAAVTARPSATTAKTTTVRNYANGYGEAAAKLRQPVMEEEFPLPGKKGIRGPLTIVVLETLGIAGLAAYWLLFLLK
jgi:hypothetical protein